MAKTLEELLAEYQKNGAYTPLTQEQMQQQATARYDSIYGQKKLSANQAYQRNEQALTSQLAGLQSTYDKQREDTAKGFRQSYSTADRQSLRRGMQRSSYNNALLANIDLAGQEAQQDINDAQAEREAAINEQRTLASQQLAQQIAQYEVAQKADELAYLDELTAREYDRGVAAQGTANDLAIAIYNAQKQQEQLDYQKQQDLLAQQNWQAQFDYQKQQDALAQENWQREFELAASKKSSGSSGSKNNNNSTPPPANYAGVSMEELLALLGAGKTANQTSTKTQIPTSVALAAGAYNYNKVKEKAASVGSVTPTGTKVSGAGKRETTGVVDPYGDKDTKARDKKVAKK